MILDNLIIRGHVGKKRILIGAGKIRSIQGIGEDDSKAKSNGSDSSVSTHDTKISFKNAIAIPGLINSHDHLDFNLYPRLSTRVYDNYTEWGNDIQHTYKTIIDAVLKIPEPLRIEWGIYKNLLNGFTTVVNHGKKISITNELISVSQDCYSLHSTAFEKAWKWKLNNPLKKDKPYVMHIGEGKDDKAKREIDTVIRSNWFRKKIIAVHGIAMDRQQAASFEGLVWCPASNEYLIGKTAAVNELKQATRVVFGTDSTLSSSWNAWQHFSTAMQRHGITEAELMAMLTTGPAALWKWDDRGEIIPDKWADIVVLKSGGDLFNSNPKDILLVMHHGNIRLYDESIASQLKAANGHTFSRIVLNESIKFVEGDIQGLIKNIRSYYKDIIFPDFT